MCLVMKESFYNTRSNLFHMADSNSEIAEFKCGNCLPRALFIIKSYVSKNIIIID